MERPFYARFRAFVGRERFSWIVLTLFIVVGSMLCAWPLYSGQQAGQRSAEEILRSYVQDFQDDPAAAAPVKNPRAAYSTGRLSSSCQTLRSTPNGVAR